MKKLFALAATLPLAVASCGGSKATNDAPSNDTNNNPGFTEAGIDKSKPFVLGNADKLERLYHTRDSISDMFTKEYNKADLDIIRNLWKSTIAVHIFDSKLGEVSGSTTREKCDNIISNKSEVGDTLVEERIAPYINKAENPYLKKLKMQDPNDSTKEVDIPKYSHWPGGEKDMQNAGTGWIVAQNNTHYFVATNHHVGLKPSVGTYNGNADLAKFGKNGPGTAWDCLGMGLINEDRSQSYISAIDYSIGNNGLVFNGRDQKHSNEAIDLAIFAVKKTNYGVDMPTLKISKTIKETDGDWSKTRDDYKTFIENTTLYSAGYPRTVRRFSKTEQAPRNWYARQWDKDRNIEGHTLKGIWDGTYVWNFHNVEFDINLGGGASGSPIINKNGEIEFILFGGQTNSARMIDDDEWTTGAAVGVPAFQIWEQINAEFCVNNEHNLGLDICN